MNFLVKNTSPDFCSKNICTSSLVYIFLALSNFHPEVALAQGEKVQPRLEITYNRAGKEVPFLSVLARIKEGKKFLPLGNVAVNFYLNDQTELGNLKTNEKGIGKLVLSPSVMRILDSLAEYNFVARIPETDKVEETEETFTIKRARIILNPTEADDAKQIMVRVEAADQGAWKAVPEVELKIFVNRYFGKVKVAEDSYTTDENGEVMVDYSLENLPGDINGEIIVGAGLEDNEDYGNISTLAQVKWGVPLSDDNREFNSRTLWATRDKTPVWLLVFPNLIILGVWATIGYLLLIIFRLRKLTNENSLNK